MASKMNSNAAHLEFRLGNECLRAKQYASAIQHYFNALMDSPELKNLVCANWIIARTRYSNIRANSKDLSVAVCGWELSHNAAGRAYNLAKLYSSFSRVELIGNIYSSWGDGLWEPIRNSGIKTTILTIDNEKEYLNQAIRLVGSKPFDIVHLSKPRIHNIIIGVLYKIIWGAKVIIDIDDEELAIVGSKEYISLEEYIKKNKTLPECRDLAGKLWTSLAVSYFDKFDATTVSNIALQHKYGGVIIRHSRTECKVTEQDKIHARKKHGIASDSKVVLFLGTPHRYKGLSEIANAISKLNRNDVKFVIVGSFVDSEFKIELQSIKQVEFQFHENTPIENIAEFLALADAVVLFQDPSSEISRYQIPAKLSDALSIGTNVLLTPTPAVSDIIASGAVIPVHSPQDITDKLSELFDGQPNDPAKSHTIKELFSLEFSDEVNSRRLQNVLEATSSFNLEHIKHFASLFPQVKPLFHDYTHLEKRRENIKEKVLSPQLDSYFAENSSASKKPEAIDKLDKDWDVREVLSAPINSGDIKRLDKIFIVPAVLSERNTKRYRVNHLMELLSDFVSVEVVNYHENNESFFRELNKNRHVVIIQRLAIYNKETEDFMNKLRSTNAFVVYEIDDQLFDASELEEWRIKGLPHKPSQYYKCMQYADHFFVSTKRLKQKIEVLFKRPAHIVQNIVNKLLVEKSLQFKAKQHPGKFIVGYSSGSYTHDYDLQIILPAIREFLQNHEDALFYCIGDVNIPDSLLDSFPDQIVFIEKVDWKDYPEILAQLSLLLVPLEHTVFNYYKSHLKYIEASLERVPVVASDFSEIAESIINNYTGILCSDQWKDWHRALEWSYDNKSEIRLFAERSYNLVVQYWSTESAFKKFKIAQILKDLTIGVLRDKLSIIVVCYNPLHDVKALIDSIIEKTNLPYELFIWNNSSNAELKEYIESLQYENVFTIDFNKNVGKAIAANALFKLAGERFVVGLDDDYIVPDYWDIKLVHAAKSIPELGWLSTNLTIDSSGIRNKGKVRVFEGGISVYLPSGVGGWVVFTTLSFFNKIGFYKEHGLYGGIDGDYNRRARQYGYLTGYVKDIIGQHKVQRHKSLAWELFKQRIQDKMRLHGKDSDLVEDKFLDFWTEKESELLIAIKVCTPLIHDENVWGDTHFALSLAKSLQKQGYNTRIDKHEEWYANTRQDITIHLFGLHKYTPDPSSINILWIISHPDLIDRDFLIHFDYIFCASSKVADLVKTIVPEIKVDVLLQCTDFDHFYSADDEERIYDVVFIGNSRRIFRNAVKYCIEGNYDVAIWGTKWEQFIPKQFIKGQSLNSSEVASIYRKARVVLNDHWQDQIDFNLVNNRIFDVLACGTHVLSDYNPGVNEIFEDLTIPMFRDKNEFTDLLNRLLSLESRQYTVDPDYIQKNHSFDNRAQEIDKAIRYIISNYVNYKSEFLYNVRQQYASIKQNGNPSQDQLTA